MFCLGRGTCSNSSWIKDATTHTTYVTVQDKNKNLDQSIKGSEDGKWEQQKMAT